MKRKAEEKARRAAERAAKRSARQDRQITYARLLGLVLVAAGCMAIGLGWAGAARRACVDCQIPYIISGGAAGVALVVFGAALLLMAQVRTEGRRLASRLEQVAVAMSQAGPVVPAPSQNGHATID